jgi:1,2-phenylacetyl-CoA epoxidase catalytic subunit
MTVDYAAEREKFFAKQRDPDQLAKLFAIFRVGEHHAVITIGDWLKSTEPLEVKDGFARLIWDEARHTRIWTQRMTELIGDDAVRRLYPDPRRVDFRNDEYFRLWDAYAEVETLPQRLAYIYLVDGWAALAYDTYLDYVDPVTKWHLQTILHDENFHVDFGRKMAEKYVTSERDRDLLRREEEKIGLILAEVTDGFLRVEV